MANRAADWFKQAQRDLEQAEDSRRAGRHEYVVAVLAQELPEERRPGADLIEKAKVLDNFCIPARYPNSHPQGAPFEHYGPLQSEEALRYAGEIVAFVRLQMA
ncbi:MAG: HEPN domain-containing protein [bacterium]